jgi:hypothetical protein
MDPHEAIWQHVDFKGGLFALAWCAQGPKQAEVAAGWQHHPEVSANRLQVLDL